MPSAGSGLAALGCKRSSGRSRLPAVRPPDASKTSRDSPGASVPGHSLPPPTPPWGPTRKLSGSGSAFVSTMGA